MATTPHLAFIAAAYIAAVAVVGILIAWVTLDYRAQRRALAEMQSRGFSRRSGPSQPRAGAAAAEAKEKA